MGQETLVKFSQMSIGLEVKILFCISPKSEEHPGNLHNHFFCFGGDGSLDADGIFFSNLVEARRLFGGGFKRFLQPLCLVEMIQFDDNCYVQGG